MKTMTAASISAMSVALLCANPTDAFAQSAVAVPTATEVPVGRSAMDEGLASMRDEDFASAVAAFERAITEGAGGVVHAHLAAANRALSRWSEAVRAWDVYLAAPPAGTLPSEIQEIRALRDSVAARCTRVRMRYQPSTAALTINGRLVTERRAWSMVNADGTRELLLDPGEYRLILRANGYQVWRTTFEAPERGVTRTFDLRLLPMTTSPGVTIAGRRVPWWTFLGGGVFLGGTSVAVALGALRVTSEARCGNDPACLASMQPESTQRTIGITVSATVGAAGLILAVYGVVAGDVPPSLANTIDFNAPPSMR